MTAPLNSPVLIMAGGTGGHIFPGLAVAGKLRQRNVDVLWLGSSHGMENGLVPRFGYPIERIDITGLRGRGALALLLLPFRLCRAVLQAIRILRRYQPRSVLSMGGFAAGPGGLAAWLTRRPLVVHEQNSIPGLTNRVLAKLARRVLSGFPSAFPRDGLHVGNPVREEIAAAPTPQERQTGQHRPPRLLVLGGSQGAVALNTLLPRAIAGLALDPAPEIRHQCGAGREEATAKAYEQAQVPATVLPFVDDMAEAYAWADLVVCRAGALTIAEVSAMGLASLLVPFPHAVDDHQTHNAGYLVSEGAARLCPEAALTTEGLSAQLTELLSAPDLLTEMAERARRLAQPDAAEAVASACLEVAR
ncbi:MAG: undecaprenyldiphospho-muramoylpentapeptide beta-N-acetylglucosaminyltransferase [Pseudomonadota bacterium]